MSPRGDEDEMVSAAIVLAAGNGDRFITGQRRSKLLHPVRGRPLIHRTLRCAQDAGIRDLTVVLGYQADDVREAVLGCDLDAMTVRFAYNPNWQLENGTSVLAARVCQPSQRFALLMGDHLFDAAVLTRMLREPAEDDDLLLAVDSRPVPEGLAAEATKVRLRYNRIADIGKHVSPYDALDTGMFIGGRSLFGALLAAAVGGDTTLSAGVRILARRGLARAVDIGDAYWRDVDTMADAQAAEVELTDTASVD